MAVAMCEFMLRVRRHFLLESLQPDRLQRLPCQEVAWPPCAAMPPRHSRRNPAGRGNGKPGPPKEPTVLPAELVRAGSWSSSITFVFPVSTAQIPGLWQELQTQAGC